MRMLACVEQDLEDAAELLRALASPVRLSIVLELCATDERCVHELVASLAAPQPLVSQHLRVLRDARLIRGRRAGREVRYSLSDDHVAHIVRDAVTHAKERKP
jgi:DNA-binding transcriptional ArsR family regulator